MHCDVILRYFWAVHRHILMIATLLRISTSLHPSPHIDTILTMYTSLLSYTLLFIVPNSLVEEM